jgi:Gpi18-like mannosyltransferase
MDSATPAPATIDARRVDMRLVVGTTLAVGIVLRALLWPWRSGDYEWGWRAWYERLVEGGFAAFKEPFYDYNPPWPMMVWAISQLDGLAPRLTLVKTTIMLFDLVLAFLVHRIVREIHPAGPRPLYAACATLLVPTVVMNAGVVVQCDALYVGCILAAVLATLRGRSAPAWAAFGASVSFKLQAIFVAPYLAACALRGRIRWRDAWLVPAIWLACLVPIWLVGRPFVELVLTYATQSATFGDLSAHAPNFWVLVHNRFYPFGYGAGLILAAAAALAYARAMQTTRAPLDAEGLLLAALVSCAFVPFLLPKMHDRYFFAADLLSLALAFANPTYVAAAVALQTASALAYLPYSLGYDTHVAAGLINVVTVPWLALRLAARLHPERLARFAPLLPPASLVRALAALALAYALWIFAVMVIGAAGRDVDETFGARRGDLPGFVIFAALWIAIALALPLLARIPSRLAGPASEAR